MESDERLRRVLNTVDENDVNEEKKRESPKPSLLISLKKKFVDELKRILFSVYKFISRMFSCTRRCYSVQEANTAILTWKIIIVIGKIFFPVGVWKRKKNDGDRWNPGDFLRQEIESGVKCRTASFLTSAHTHTPHINFVMRSKKSVPFKGSWYFEPGVM